MTKATVRDLKLNNKKGFSLVELLVAVAIIAIVTPFLIKGFIYASELNYRSRLQQRADAAASSVYEGVASLKYEELENYFSAINGWEDIKQPGEDYTYHVTKYYDDLEDCKINVMVQEYSESYIVPDLNFIGVKSKYLTLSGEINDFDGTIKSKIEQAIKSDTTVKTAIKYDIIQKISATYGRIYSASEIDASKILIDCGTIDEEKISKQVNVDFKTAGGEFVADYTTSYRYPADVADPDRDSTAALKIGYSYSHKVDGKWISVSNTSLNVKEALKSNNASLYPNYQFVMEGFNGSVSVAVSGEASSPQSAFIYYNPVSDKDWIKLSSQTSTPVHKIYLIEQGVDKGEECKLSFSIDPTAKNNFEYSVSSKPTSDHAQILQQSGGTVDLYSNITTVSAKGIPDAIYESTEEKAKMYRVQVEVIYQSNIFADVSGSFKAGGGNVNKYEKD